MDVTNNRQPTKMILLAIVIVLILTPADAITQNDNANNAMVDFNVNDIASGKYNFRFHGSDNIEREESGGFSDGGQYVVRGFYSYTDGTGRKYIIKYTADKDGYHPVVMVTSDSRLPLTTPSPSVGFGAPAPVIASLLG